MPYSNKQMLRDANGDLIPQYWDVVEQEFKPLTGSDGANDVRLTGSKVEEDILIERSIISQSTENVVDIPEGVKGAIFHARVRSLTGDFNNGQGISAEVHLAKRYPSGGHFFILGMDTDYKSSNTSFHTLIFQQSLSFDDAYTHLSNSELKGSSLTLNLFELCRFRLRLTGQNIEADVEAVVKWVF